MRKIIVLFLLQISFGLSAQINWVVPTPSSITLEKGDYLFADLIEVNDSDLPEFSKDILKRFIAQELNRNVLFTSKGKDILFQKLQNVPSDSYSILVANEIRISYSSDASCFYALQTLFQMVDTEVGNIQKGFVNDQPKFAWRGMHLDCSRHFFTVDEIKKYLDLMARYKFNTFHWHLTDDQGWRIEIRKYPKLTEVGSVRAQSLVGHASADPEKYDGNEVKGYYTQNDIREIVAYANKRYIKVVPEIELPGHASAAIAAYPELNCKDTIVRVVEKWGVFDDVFCTQPQTIQFLKDVLSEVCQLFPSDYIHIGGDEVPKNHWEKCRKCQETMSKNGLKNTHELQSYVIRQMDEFLTARGKKIIGWDEILEGGLSPNAAVMSWRGTKGGIEAAQQEHFVVMTPTSHCYFDHYQGESSKEPLAIGGYLPLSKVFDFNPIPKGLEPYQETYILGAQANLWTEYIPDVRQLDYMIFPRLLALSEVVWSTNKCSYEHFLDKLENKQFPFLDSKNVNYSLSHRRTQTDVISKNGIVGIAAKATNPEWNVSIACKKRHSISSQGSSFYPIPKVSQAIEEEYLVTTQSENKVLGTDTVRIFNHPFIGEKWEYQTPPSEHYPGKGYVSLTDGVTGSRPWNGKEWLGFQGDTLQFTYSFSSTDVHGSIYMYLLESKPSWIYLPKEIICTYYKANGKIKTVTKTTDIKETMTIPQSAKWSKVDVQFVMDTKIPEGKPGEGQAPWFFLAELLIMP